MPKLVSWFWHNQQTLHKQHSRYLRNQVFWDMTTGPSFRTSGTSHPGTHCHIQEDMNPQKECCEKSYLT